MRTRRLVAAVAVIVVVTAACSSDDGSFELGDDDGSAAAVEKPRVEVTEDPDPPPPDDDEPLYPPLPPLEPDPDSDVEVGLQEAILDLHAEVYHLTQTALATGEFDAEELEEVLGGELLDSVLASFTERQEHGITERSPDSEVRYIRVVSGGAGPVVVWECRVVGPETLDVDANGEPISETQRDGPVPVLFEVTYEVLEVSAGVLGYRATFNERLSDAGDCGE